MDEFKLELQSGNAQLGSKPVIFFPRVTVKFDTRPWKTIGHLTYKLCASFWSKSWMGEFKFELQSGNAQFGSKSAILCSVWPWNLMDDGWFWKTIGTSSILCLPLSMISKPSVNTNLSCSPEMLNSGQNWWFFILCHLEIWWITLKNNKTPLLSNMRHHIWILELLE